nr:hypothetical protein [Kibdelosporangium sp. MJ126-NF4]
MEALPERTGTLILRAWVEDSPPYRLRVRVLPSIGPHQSSPRAVSEVEDVLAAVQAWLDELMGQGGDAAVTPP